MMIPVYNRQDYIGPAIESVLAQTYSNFELIVHDDASTDNTLNVIKKYQDDSRLKIIHTDSNHGMIGGWNYLFSHAKGGYLKQMGSDDLLHPRCLEKELDALLSNSNLSLVTCARQVIDAGGKHINTFRFANSSQTVSGPHHGHWLLTTIRENKIGEPAAVMFPRKLLAQAGEFDPQFSQYADFEFWLRLLALGDMAYLNEPLCFFRLHAGTNTSDAQLDGRFITETFKLIKKYYQNDNYCRAFNLSHDDEKRVRKLKTLDFLKNIKDLFLAGKFPQALTYSGRLLHGLLK